jgi:hypothetical protein
MAIVVPTFNTILITFITRESWTAASRCSWKSLLASQLSPPCKHDQMVKLLTCQNHWVCWFGPAAGILNTRKHEVSEIGCSSVFRRREGDTYSVGRIKESSPLSLNSSVIHHRQRLLDSTTWLVFGKYLLRISPGTPTILAEVRHGFPSVPNTNGTRGSVVVKATSRKVVSSRSDEVKEFFFFSLPNPSGRIRLWGSLSH